MTFSHQPPHFSTSVLRHSSAALNYLGFLIFLCRISLSSQGHSWDYHSTYVCIIFSETSWLVLSFWAFSVSFLSGRRFIIFMVDQNIDTDRNSASRLSVGISSRQNRPIPPDFSRKLANSYFRKQGTFFMSPGEKPANVLLKNHLPISSTIIGLRLVSEICSLVWLSSQSAHVLYRYAYVFHVSVAFNIGSYLTLCSQSNFPVPFSLLW